MHALGPRNATVRYDFYTSAKLASDHESQLTKIEPRWRPKWPKWPEMLKFCQEWNVDSPIIPENTCARIRSAIEEVSIMCKE